MQTLTLRISSTELKYIGFQEKGSEQQLIEEEKELQIDNAISNPSKLEQRYVLLAEKEKNAYLISYLIASNERKADNTFFTFLNRIP